MTARSSEPVGTLEGSGPGGLVRLRAEVAYDGGGFHGWARQPGLRTVQAELERALGTVLRLPDPTSVRVAVAGRTDAGVHAVGQVCHADVPISAWERATVVREPRADPEPPGVVLRRRLNGLLPDDLRVRDLEVAAPGFDARWSASWRRYSYLVADDPAVADPRLRGHVLWHRRGLDVAAMDTSARPFLGEHDFTAFCRARDGASAVRTIHEIGWRRLAIGTGPDRDRAGGRGSGPGLVEFEVRADAFCHSMVRGLVGAFLSVGDGRWPADRPAALLVAARRVSVLPTAPAHGLTLVEVGYPPDDELGAQATRAKRWRGA